MPAAIRRLPYTRLFLYPATSLVASVLIYLLAAIAMKVFPKWSDSKGIRCTLVDIAACCLSLIILCSTCVALTMGKCHFVMFAEPVIFLILIAAIVVGEVRLCKSHSPTQE